MAALLVLLLAAAWLEDALLRRVVDASLHRRALLDTAGSALAGSVLVACAVELMLPLPAPLARAALHAFALVLTGCALAAEDAVPPGTAKLRLLREAAPLVAAPAIAVAVGALLAVDDAGLRGAMLLAAWTGVLLFVRTIAPELDARIAVAGRAAPSLRSPRLASAVLLALALLGARAWLP